MIIFHILNDKFYKNKFNKILVFLNNKIKNKNKYSRIKNKIKFEIYKNKKM